MQISSRRPYINILLSTVCKASENGHLCKISQACYFKEKLWAQWWNKFQGSTKIIENISCQNIEISMNNITRKNSNRKKKESCGYNGKMTTAKREKGESNMATGNARNLREGGHMIYISGADQVSSNSLVRNPFLPPCYYKWVSLRAAFHLSESEIGRENQPTCSTAIPAF